MNSQQSLGGGARAFSPLRYKNKTLLQKDENSCIINNIFVNNEGFMKKGFTLAEVLITLGIIGVVAAMTMPTLIGKYQKRETVTKLQKFYSIMQQAIKLSEVHNGELKYWDFNIGGNEHTEIFTDTYLKPYLKIVKEYKPADFPADIHYKCLNGDNCDGYGEAKNNNPKLVLADGIMILAADLASSTDGNNDMMNIYVDINGFNKPNQYGRDVFAFSLQKGVGFVPLGMGLTNDISNSSEGYDRDWFISAGGNYRGCNINKHGIYCAGLIMVDGWEIKDDYPW